MATGQFHELLVSKARRDLLATVIVRTMPKLAGRMTVENTNGTYGHHGPLYGIQVTGISRKTAERLTDLSQEIYQAQLQTKAEA